jgi:DNA-binding transcriptional ArsR family regulator
MAETLDRSALKALSTETRQDIVKMLSERPHTSSEIARKLGKHVTTITEHLDVLEKANLIIRKESTNKWIYYALTSKGEKIFKPANYTWVITLSLIMVAVVAVSMFGFFRSGMENAGTPEMMSQKAGAEYYADFQQTIETDTSSIVPLTISGGSFDENIEIEISHKETEKPIIVNSERIKIAEIENKSELVESQAGIEALTRRKFVVRISEPVDINGEKVVPVEISETRYEPEGNEEDKKENTIDVDIIGPSGNTKRVRVNIDR